VNESALAATASPAIASSRVKQIDINSSLTDALSEPVHEILKIDPDLAYTRLVVHTGDGNEVAKNLLRQLKLDNLLAKPVISQPDAQALLSGLWLWHDWLDESHTISQSIETETGSFWHAIMHRREGDFSNAKYWYARCRNHPVLRSMAQFANDILHPQPADKTLLRLVHDGWNPNAFVDLAEAVYRRPEDPRYPVAVALQKLEWRLLFDHCMRQASGQ
jgi:hypothetical protein